MTAELRMTLADLGALEREIAQNLKYGRAFLPEAADVQVLSDCVLVLTHPLHGNELRLTAYVVMVSADGPMKGTGIELRPWGPDSIAQLERFVHEVPAAPPAAAEAEAETTTQASPEASPEAQPAASEEASTASDSVETASEEASAASDTAADASASVAPPDADAEPHADDEHEPTELQLENKQEKLRHLSITEQMKVARTGELADRIVVERLYGKQVWDALLHNPRLSIPEVARIARKGTVPKPLLEVIMDNGAWIKAPQVRRALFTNPKCGSDAIAKLLRVTPKHELKQIEKSTAYTQQVREAARKLLKAQEQR